MCSLSAVGIFVVVVKFLHLHIILHNELLNFNQTYEKGPGKGPQIASKFITHNKGCKQHLQK